MGFAETMRIMSGINCFLGSGVTYLEQRTNGVSPGYALPILFGNVTNGLARNEAAYEMQKWGNPMGNIINSFAGYGNPISNTIGTLGIMSALTPWMFFNMPGCYMMPWGSSMSYSHHVSYSF